MLSGKIILVVDCNTYSSLNLCEAIEQCDGRVAGPVVDAAEALSFIGTHTLSGASIDCDLAETQSVELVLRLLDEKVAVVLQATSRALPAVLESRSSEMVALIKPVDPDLIIHGIVSRL